MDHDTKALLLECGAGVQMAVGAIDDVLGQTRDKKLEQALLSCREAHKALGQQTKALLDAEHIPEKGANAMARGMSWLKTSTKLAVSPADETVADLITDDDRSEENIIPGAFDPRVAEAVANAVAKAARESGVARL